MDPKETLHFCRSKGKSCRLSLQVEVSMWRELAWTQPSAETRARGLRWLLDVSETLGGDQTGPAQKDRQENICSRSESHSDCQRVRK